jgi:hypothetical protein
LTKNGLGYILGDFFTNWSGHLELWTLFTTAVYCIYSANFSLHSCKNIPPNFPPCATVPDPTTPEYATATPAL